MVKKLLFLILVGLTIFIAGCASSGNILPFTTTNIGDLTKNFDAYVNKNITISGTYGMNYLAGYNILIDDQGYQIRIDCEEGNRNIYEGSKYKAEGIVTFSDTCGECQYREYYNITKDEFYEMNFTQVTEDNYIGTPYNGISVDKTIPTGPDEGWKIGGTCQPSQSIESSQTEVTDYYGYISNSTGTFVSANYWAQTKEPTSQISTLYITETRCNPNSISRNYYFKCTEPMVKIS